MIVYLLIAYPIHYVCNLFLVWLQTLSDAWLNWVGSLAFYTEGYFVSLYSLLFFFCTTSAWLSVQTSAFTKYTHSNLIWLVLFRCSQIGLSGQLYMRVARIYISNVQEQNVVNVYWLTDANYLNFHMTLSL